MKTQSALCAKEIKKILTAKFPKIKFSVGSQNYAGGDSVNVSYNDGVPTQEVEKWIKGFQYGHFDGMTDMYEYSNHVEGRPQTKYLFVSRHINPEFKQKIKEDIAKQFGIVNSEDEQEWYNKFRSWSDQVVWKELKEISFV